MPEYIERENAYKLISEQKEKETGMYSKGRNTGLNIAKSIIHDKERCPSVDVVEVVRCEKCLYCKPTAKDGILACIRKSEYIKPTDYCSYGERKKSEVQGNA